MSLILDNRNLQALSYWMEKEWPGVPLPKDRWKYSDGAPRSEWPVRNGIYDHKTEGSGSEKEGPAGPWAPGNYSVSRLW